MKRHGRVRMTLKGHAQDSWAELEIPVEEVVSGLSKFLRTDLPGSFEIDEFYASGEGIRVTLERVPKKPAE